MVKYNLKELFHFISLRKLQKLLKLRVRFRKSVIKIPLELSFSNLDNIHIGDEVVIDTYCVLRILNDCTLFIGEGTYIGPFCHISGTQNKIVIGRKVTIADRVFISTTHHRYGDPSRPIREQGYFSKGDVIIGDGAWIGIGACILSGVQIGKGSVIGANSVVTHNIPSYSVAAGSPARVIKRYDFSSKRWLRV